MAAVRSSKLLHKCVASPTGKHSASVIFLHGSGVYILQWSLSWVKEVSLPDLAFPHIRVVYPTALARPYTPMRGGGVLSNVWFDLYKISRDCLEHLESIDRPNGPSTMTCSVLSCSSSKGGFSMGGAMALHLVCRYHRGIAGVLLCPAVEERARAGSPLPELFQGHGTGDELVFHKWGGETTAVLKKAGMTTTLHSFQGLQHQLFRPEIELLRSWILTKLLPDPHQAAPGSSPSCSRILTKLLPDPHQAAPGSSPSCSRTV
uniref:palmitoyl-protein hydrolase n=1 Tax=Oncorhynchus kisutch TaxID=8019 RepID=A0A8C7D9Y6_ONCKI